MAEIKKQEELVLKPSSRCIKCGRLYRVTKGACLYGEEKKPRCLYFLKG